MANNVRPRVISADEPDVRWLVDLLTLLPPMTADVGRDVVGERRVDPELRVESIEQEAAGWWDRFAQLHPAEMDGHYCRVHLLPYVLRIVSGEARESDVSSLAQYCLVFFDVADRPECCELLDEVVSSHLPKPAGTAGRRWAESVMEVAWRLYVPRQARVRLREGLAAWPQPDGS